MEGVIFWKNKGGGAIESRLSGKVQALVGHVVQQFGPALSLRPSALPMKPAKCEMHPFRLALFGKIGKIWGNCRRGIESTRRVKPNVRHLGARTMVGYTVNGNERACRAVVGSGPVKREAGTWAETSR